MPAWLVTLLGTLVVTLLPCAQAPTGGFTPADLDELKAYRLSAATLKKVDAATSAVARIRTTDPNYPALRTAVMAVENPFGFTSTDHGPLSVLEQNVANVPPLAAALAARGLTAREYVKFMVVVVQAYMVTEIRAEVPAPYKDAAVEYFGEIPEANRRFVTANKRAVVSLLELVAKVTR